ncbi:phosphoglycolate phosphatase [Enterobacter asburiae]|uniref:Phosphoglycolate phosphatase n=1 Tax=Enterobacter asburiae TaxID=61645 RepID=A0A376FGK3_ENTAS|nr:phosphoglycolate phosphatase [Enterobacter asburiae]
MHLNSPLRGEDRVVTWIGNGADVLMERALTWARQERASQRSAQGKPSVDHADIPKDEQLRILRKLFDRFYEETVEEGSFLFPDVQETLSALHAKGIPAGAGDQQTDAVRCASAGSARYREVFLRDCGRRTTCRNKKARIRNRCCWWQENYP